MVLKNGLETVINVQLSDTQWKQASRPVHMGGLGVMSACMLTPSAFLASAAATLPLQEAILSVSNRRSRRHRSIQHQNHVELSGEHDRTLRHVQAHQTSLGRSCHIRRLYRSDVYLSITGRSSKVESSSNSTRRRLATCSTADRRWPPAV